MIHTRTITTDDYPAVAALWATLHAQAIPNNCWPGAPSDEMLMHLAERYDWAVAEEVAGSREPVAGEKNPQSVPKGSATFRNPQSLLGFAFWRIDPDGNASVRAIAALDEAAYLCLVLAAVSASQTKACGMLARNRPERTWFQNIGATFEPCGFASLTPAEESRFAGRADKLAARAPVQDRVIVPVSRIPAIQTRLVALEGTN